MAGKIFVLRDGDALTELTPSPYSDEDFFQGLIEKHPEILAGDQINPDNPRKWVCPPTRTLSPHYLSHMKT